MSDIVKAIILGIVEGITEFLPISSTGHLILVNQFIAFDEEFTKMFDIVIQLGAILSVVIYFWKRLFVFKKIDGSYFKSQTADLWMKAIVGIIPAMIIGVLCGEKIQESLFDPITVSCALIIGGIALILLENRRKQEKISTIASLSYKTVLLIGLIQCLAMIPGTSRSAATIIGAMLLGCSRLVAAEYSFFLAIPTLFAASVYSLFKTGFSMTRDEEIILAVGFVVSFIVAFVVIAGFMRFISRHDFKPFGWYRIILGGIILAYFMIV
ncbi:MAG: undecaprenyl-diphosphate phosphatase [Bacteroidetes bacterium]|nr:undecaprenyl-diphosphate phosphatase [Bacteroidota bacterium]